MHATGTSPSEAALEIGIALWATSPMKPYFDIGAGQFVSDGKGDWTLGSLQVHQSRRRI